MKSITFKMQNISNISKMQNISYRPNSLKTEAMEVSLNKIFNILNT